MPENSRRNRNTWIAALVISLLIGLVVGVVVSVVFFLPDMTQEGTGVINPVQVSGTVNETLTGSIQFVNYNESISTRYNHHASIVNGQYSIVLSGGESYSVYIGTGETGYTSEYSLHVPSNVTTFTANF